MTSPIAGKVIAVTGAASGIGLATSHVLAERGVKLSLADLNTTNLAAAEKSIKEKFPNAEVLITTVDVMSTESVDAWMSATISKYGRLDGAANLAGVIGPGIGHTGVQDMSDKEWDFVMGVNLTGAFKSLRAELKVMSEGGSVVNTSSVAGIKGFPYNSAYTAGKWGVIGLTKSAAGEVGDRNIRVNCINPGWIETPMTALSAKIHAESAKDANQHVSMTKTPISRPGQPTEIASLICFLLGDESKFITGTHHVIDGGMTAV